jgi:NADPH:quinone reductase-like Zn-dependent oxidoreductase
MKAVVLHEYGGPEKLKFEDHVPQPQVSGDTVLIATTAASVNPIDWKIRSGARQKDFPLSFPAILGRDVSGVVRAVGANVKHLKPGERVLALTNATYAELVAVDDADVTHLPDGLDLADAAALPPLTQKQAKLCGMANGGGTVASSPMTYELDGRQYVVIGANHVLYAWAVPESAANQ